VTVTIILCSPSPSPSPPAGFLLQCGGQGLHPLHPQSRPRPCPCARARDADVPAAADVYLLSLVTLLSLLSLFPTPICILHYTALRSIGSAPHTPPHCSGMLSRCMRTAHSRWSLASFHFTLLLLLHCCHELIIIGTITITIMITSTDTALTQQMILLHCCHTAATLLSHYCYTALTTAGGLPSAWDDANTIIIALYRHNRHSQRP
jgi:hypothetical protein